MVDPIRMVVIDVLASLCVGVGIVIYTKIAKKKINFFYLLIIISVLPLISMLRKGSYESGDLSLHAKLSMQFYENLLQGNILPSWIQTHCLGFGCPGYTFLFILPYYLICFSHLLGFSFLASVKLLMAFSYIASGIGMFYWVKEELGEKSGFVASIFYLYAPYHLIDLHFRISIGELLSMAILPFIFLSIKLTIEKKQIKYLISSMLLMSSLILSHQVTSLIVLPFIFLYIFITWLNNNKKKISVLVVTIFSILFGIAATSFYWLRIILEKKYILYGSSNQLEFHNFSEFFFSPYRFGLLFQGKMGELYMNVGYTQWLIIFFAFFLVYRNKMNTKEKNLLIFFLSSVAFLFILMQSFSKPLWDIFAFTKSIQFSWRLMIEVSFFVSVIAGIITKHTKSNKLLILLCAITILYTILNWGNRTTEPKIIDSVLKKQTIFVDENIVEITTPIWTKTTSSNKYTRQSVPAETLSGEADIIPLARLQTNHEYIINVKKDTTIKENTFYYPGWKIYANDKEIPITYTSSMFPGIITFHLNKGIYKINIMFLNTPLRNFTDVVSSFSIIAFYFFIQYTKKYLSPRTQ